MAQKTWCVCPVPGSYCSVSHLSDPAFPLSIVFAQFVVFRTLHSTSQWCNCHQPDSVQNIFLREAHENYKFAQKEAAINNTTKETIISWLTSEAPIVTDLKEERIKQVENGKRSSEKEMRTEKEEVIQGRNRRECSIASRMKWTKTSEKE